MSEMTKSACAVCLKPIEVGVEYMYVGGNPVHAVPCKPVPPGAPPISAEAVNLAVHVITGQEVPVTDTDVMGKKNDAGKPRPDLIPPLAELGVAKVLQFGAEKYGPDNWRKVPDLKARYEAALRRHILYWKAGEANDPESGLSHLDHAICSLLFLSELEKEGKL